MIDYVDYVSIIMPLKRINLNKSLFNFIGIFQNFVDDELLTFNNEKKKNRKITTKISKQKECTTHEI